MPVKSGRYYFINVQQKNHAFLPNPHSIEPLQSRYRQNDPGEQWDVIDRKNGHHTIVNFAHKQYASSVSRATSGEHVVGFERDQTWLIQKTIVKGQYTISTTDSKHFWGIPDHEEGTPITLSDAYTDKRNWWELKDVVTGKDAEVNPDLNHGRTAYDADGDMGIQSVLFELILPPISVSKPFLLDLLIIQEMPNEFIPNATVTANKICRPLVKSGQLDPSDLRIEVIEFEPLSDGHTQQRVSGIKTFDELRDYRSWDFPWNECPEPAILSSLITGMKDFRSSATKVVVLNLRYILRNGGESLSQVIRQMANDGIIVILTLSQPHLSDTLFDMDLFQELARLSSAILSLPADGGLFYSCIVDYLQDFDVDSMHVKFPDVDFINAEIPLSQRKPVNTDSAIGDPSTSDQMPNGDATGYNGILPE